MISVRVIGRKGLVGSACARLESDDFESQYAYNDFTLMCDAVEALSGSPSVVILAAARVGGIQGNLSRPVTMIEDNLLIQTNCIRAAVDKGIPKFVFLGSSCIYPPSPEPIKEDALLSGPLEPSNQAYAVAKIAGIELCRAYTQEALVTGAVSCRSPSSTRFICPMPCNLYGPNDRYGPGAHVIPMLVERFVQAVEQGAATVEVWGSGTPLREFLYVDDLARAIQMLYTLEDPPFLVNVGSGVEVTVGRLAELVADACGFQGRIVFNTTKPDGARRKVLDSTLMRSHGWASTVFLEEGLARVVADYRAGGGRR